MITFLHTFRPKAILISFGSVDIYWYGLLIVAGILTAIAVTLKLAKFYNIKKDTIMDLAFWLATSGIIGARIYHVLLEWKYYIVNPIDIFKIWQGGLAIHGGIIAGIIVIWLYCRKHKLNGWLIASLIAPGLALAQAIGRWGNYFNQEIIGRPTDLPWGIPIDFANRPIEYINNIYFHPAFLYESIGNLIIFLILISIHVWLIKTMAASREPRVMRYKLCVTSYAILYSILRFSMEFIRTDPTPIIIGLRFPQIISLLIILASIVFLAAKLKPIKAKINTLE
ncbi:prolipoprotein diacylglyceryl transferase [Candidatus Parcubacteria bacterium]|nr:prolipoprotein diacylglyceryl transferase [Patescibacteria group bacterium]MCG2697585.1 prolipoprotein diacylglyceryl transferase [Candidatus Parcubacteria bacterium]